MLTGTVIKEVRIYNFHSNPFVDYNRTDGAKKIKKNEMEPFGSSKKLKKTKKIFFVSQLLFY